MHTALMGVRTDPSTAHGYAPSELLLGRKLVYPIELKKKPLTLRVTILQVHFVFLKSITFLKNLWFLRIQIHFHTNMLVNIFLLIIEARNLQHH